MNTGLIPARYATALIDFAIQSNAVEQVYAEAKAVGQSFFQFNKLKKALENPVLAKAEKKKIIVLAAGGKVSQPFNKFIDLLIVNEREEFLQSIMLKYIDLYRKKNNIHFGKLTTASKVDAATEKRLIALVESKTGGTIEMEKIINPAIVGGFTFEVDFIRWDASIARQLQMIKNEYIEVNKSIA